MPDFNETNAAFRIALLRLLDTQKALDKEIQEKQEQFVTNQEHLALLQRIMNQLPPLSPDFDTQSYLENLISDTIEAEEGEGENGNESEDGTTPPAD
jgi:hypothetical protein